MEPAALSSNEIEAANRGEATALLIRSGYRVYRPEADVAGEDLVLRAPNGDLLPVQMKGRPFVAPDQYGGKGIWMLFPDPKGAIPGREWYLVPHDDLLSIIRERRRKEPHSGKPWSYASIPEGMRRDLADYTLRHRVVSDPEREAVS